MLKGKNIFLAAAVVILLFTALLWGTSGMNVATAENEGPERIIRVFGEAEISAPPDRAVIVLGVETKGEQAGETVAENARLMEEVVKALQQKGLKKDQLKTGNYHVHSYREYFEPSRSMDPLRPKAEPEYKDIYRVYNELSVTLEKFEETGTVIDTAVRAGANQIQSVRFERKNVEDLKLQGLKAATTQAGAKGRAIAASAGLTIKGIKSISEEMSSYTPYRAPLMEDSLKIIGAGADTPIIPGDVNIHARVVVEYYF